MTQEAKTILGIGIATLVIVLGAVFFLDKGFSQTPDTSLADAKLLVREDSWKIASDSAKVTVVEFADFECPACAAAHPIAQKIVEEYKGRINYVFRHFPLPQHQNGLKAALAAEAAGEQGRFWEMYDKLFVTQEEWSPIEDPRPNFLNYAKELGLDTDRFQTSVNANKFADKIQKDQNDGASLGVNSTPTFYVNGQKLSSFAYNEFKTKIDTELNK